MEQKQNERISKRKTRHGVVVSNKMQKTVVVKLSRTFQHPKYRKIITRTKKIYVHSEQPLEIGDIVEVIETRPLSKLKRWRIMESEKYRSN